jgi:hypothetical protein
MRTGSFIAIIVGLALFRPAPAAAQAPDGRPDLAANAAIKYWQAFAFLGTLNKDQEKLVAEWHKAPLDAKTLALINDSRTCRLYLHRGATLQRCDWGLNYEDGFRLLMPHLTKSRTLANLTALHARHEFEQGHWKAGADDVVAILKLARHLESDAMIMNHLMGYTIETTALKAAAPFLPELKAILPGTVSALLAAPPARATLRQMVSLEKQVGAVWLIRELKQVERSKEGAWLDVWKEVLSAPGEGEVVDKNLVKSAQTLDQAVKILEDLLPLYDELADVAALPWKDFDAAYARFAKKAKAANPLAGYMLPALNHVAAAQRKAQAQRAMFTAALAVVKDGPEKLKDFRDPFGDGPFEYRTLDKGFELRSKLLVRDQPMTLTVGSGEKQ